MAEVTRAGNALVVLQGTITYLPSDMQTEALAVLDDQDVGIAVVVTYKYKPIVGMLSPNTKDIREYAVELRAKNVKLI